MESNTIGFTLVDTLVKQLHADLHFNTATGEGTDFTVAFTKRQKKGSGSINMVY